MFRPYDTPCRGSNTYWTRGALLANASISCECHRCPHRKKGARGRVEEVKATKAARSHETRSHCGSRIDDRRRSHTMTSPAGVQETGSSTVEQLSVLPGILLGGSVEHGYLARSCVDKNRAFSVTLEVFTVGRARRGGNASRRGRPDGARVRGGPRAELHRAAHETSVLGAA